MDTQNSEASIPQSAVAQSVVMNAATKPKFGWRNMALGSFSSPEQMAFIHKVYGWMCGGLVVSALVSLWVVVTPSIAQIIIGNEFVFYGLLIAELVAVIFLARKVHTISSSVSAVVFILYSALNGLTLSVIFFVYTFGSILEVFLLTAGMFGVMSLYGFLTKRDLTTMGNLVVMALFGLVAALLINLFLRSSIMDFILACIGVVIFVLLTAYDTQKLKWLYALGQTEGADGEKKEAINGALTLYLDFINLFLSLLRIFGRRR